jgi:hypothetical protein
MFCFVVLTGCSGNSNITLSRITATTRTLTDCHFCIGVVIIPSFHSCLNGRRVVSYSFQTTNRHLRLTFCGIMLKTYDTAQRSIVSTVIIAAAFKNYQLFWQIMYDCERMTIGYFDCKLIFATLTNGGAGHSTIPNGGLHTGRTYISVGLLEKHDFVNFLTFPVGSNLMVIL